MNISNIKKYGLALLSVLIGLAFILLTYLYTQPMEDLFYDLSINFADGQLLENWDGDTKGWTVYTQEGEEKTPLHINSAGTYETLAYAGQTVYFSRIMTEQLDSPHLSIAAATNALTVFLNDTVIYTDAPTADAAIGSVNLEMLTWFREEGVSIPLPNDYMGRELTVAMSTPLYSEKVSDAPPLEVFIPDISLSCGYAYESTLISESFVSAIHLTLLAVVGIFSLCMFMYKGITDCFDWKILIGTLMVLLFALTTMVSTSFFHAYFGISFVDFNLYSKLLSVCFLLFFCMLQAKQSSRMLQGITLVNVLCVAMVLGIDFLTKGVLANDVVTFFRLALPQQLAFFSLLYLLGYYMVYFRTQDLFGKLFVYCNAIGILSYLIYVFFAPNRDFILMQYAIALENFSFGYPLWRLLSLMLVSAILALVIVQMQKLLDMHAEKLIMHKYELLANNSFESMKLQHEKVMILRHDMIKHFEAIRQLTKEQGMYDYITELIGENKKIHPIVMSGNEIVDMILNGSLAKVQANNLRIDIVRSSCGNLPLSTPETASLLMNIMDNICKAIANCPNPYIKIDISIKNQFTVFSFENSVLENQPCGSGYGLKIIGRIAHSYGGLMKSERHTDRFQITVAIPNCN